MSIFNSKLAEVGMQVAKAGYNAVESKSARENTLNVLKANADKSRADALKAAERQKRESDARKAMAEERRLEKVAEFRKIEDAKPWNQPVKRDFLGGDEISNTNMGRFVQNSKEVGEKIAKTGGDILDVSKFFAGEVKKGANIVGKAGYNMGKSLTDKVGEGVDIIKEDGIKSVTKDVAGEWLKGANIIKENPGEVWTGVKGGVVSNVYGTLASATDLTAAISDLIAETPYANKEMAEGVSKWLHNYANDMREGASIVNEDLGVNDSDLAGITSEVTNTGLGLLELFGGGASGVNAMLKAQSLMTAGNTYMETRDAGKGKAQSFFTGASVGALDYVTNKVGVEGVMGKGVVGKFMNKVSAKVATLPKFAQVAIGMTMAGAGEMVEEDVNLLGSSAIMKLSIGKDMPGWMDYVKTSLMSLGVGGAARGVFYKAHQQSKSNLVETMVEKGVDKGVAIRTMSEFDKALWDDMRQANAMGFNRMIGLKGLNKGTPGIDFPIPLPDTKDTTAVAPELESDVKRKAESERLIAEKKETFIKKISEDSFIEETYGKDAEIVKNELGDMFNTLDASEAGSRGSYWDDASNKQIFYKKPSSFPQWLEPRLRRRKLFDSYSEKVGTDAKFTKNEQELHDILMKRLDTTLSAKGVDLFENVTPEETKNRKGGVRGDKIAKMIVGTRVVTPGMKTRARLFKQRIIDRTKHERKIRKIEFNNALEKERQATIEQNQKDLIEYLKVKLPYGERGRAPQLNDIRLMDTNKRFAKAIEKIDKIADTYEANKYKDKIAKIIKISKLNKDSSGNFVKKMDVEAQKFINEVTAMQKRKLSRKASVAEIDTLLAPYRESGEPVPLDVLDKVTLIRATTITSDMTAKEAKYAYEQLKSVYETGKTKFREEVEEKRKRRADTVKTWTDKVLNGDELNQGVVQGHVNPTQRVRESFRKKILGKGADILNKGEDLYHGGMTAIEKMIGVGEHMDNFILESVGARDKAAKIRLENRKNINTLLVNSLRDAKAANVAGNIVTRNIKKVIRKVVPSKKTTKKVKNIQDHIKEDSEVNMKLNLAGVDYDFSQFSLAHLWGMHKSGDAAIQENLKNGNKFTQKDYDLVGKVLSPHMKLFAENISEDVYKYQAEVVAPQYEKDQGTEFISRDGYLGMIKGTPDVDVENLNILDSKNVNKNIGTTPSYTKSLTGDVSPLKFVNLYQSAIKTGDAGAIYATHTDLAKDLKSVLYNKEFTAAAKQKGYSSTLKAARGALDDLIRGGIDTSKYSDTDRALLKAQNNIISSTMKMNAISGLTQTTSGVAFAAYTDLNTAEIAAGVKANLKNLKANRKKWKSNAIIQERLARGSSIEYITALKDELSIDKGGNLIQGAENIVTKGDFEGLFAATAPIYEGLKLKYAKQGMDAKKAEKLAFYKALDFGFKVQQDADPMYMPRIKADSATGRIFSAFKSSLMSQARTMINDVRNALKGTVSVTAGMRSVATYGVAMAFMYEFVRSLGGWDNAKDEVLSLKNFIKRFPVFGEIPIVMYDVGKDTFSGEMTSKTFRNAATTMIPLSAYITNPIGAAYSINKARKSGETGDVIMAMGDTLKFLSAHFGVGPGGQLNKMTDATADYVSGKSKDPRRLAVGSYSLGDREMLGEKAKIDEMFDDKDDRPLTTEEERAMRNDITDRVKSGEITAKEGATELKSMVSGQEYVKNRDLFINAVKKGKPSANKVKALIESSYDSKMFTEAEATKVIKKMYNDNMLKKSERDYLLKATEALSER